MITVYTKNKCAQCSMTKKLLKKLGLSFTEINIEEEVSVKEELQGLGWLSLPVVYTGTTSWSGYRPDKIKALIT